jgi:hypothetical protein
MIARDFRVPEKNTLKGFFSLELTSGLVIHECSLHEKDGKAWISLPAKPQLDFEGRHRIGNDGKKLYSPVIEFRNDKIKRNFVAKATRVALRKGASS